MKYIGTTKQLLENGFEYVTEFEAHVRHCEYTRDNQLYKDILCVRDNTNELYVDIPRYCKDDVYIEVGKDLIELGLIEGEK
jgi:hypothetical protein